MVVPPCGTEHPETVDEHARSHAESPDDDPFAQITETEWEDAAARHRAAHGSTEDAPLNPEQRAAGRGFVKLARMRKEVRQAVSRQMPNATPSEIARQVAALS